MTLLITPNKRLTERTKHPAAIIFFLCNHYATGARRIPFMMVLIKEVFESLVAAIRKYGTTLKLDLNSTIDLRKVHKGRYETPLF